ncbi:DotA/TraY family protein [Flexibacterium corallicola]|uniref:DotA/TraY family protein n=1 Tax=Flexibacterium corallicola TaxID=3037259 RepID=UPI00286F4473|nr:DotA/TraY family protein [Pseudovibrio sp. M1P-2-3]
MSTVASTISDLLAEPKDTDLAWRWVEALFPLGESPIGDAFGTVSGVVTFFGALLMGWHIISGVVSTASSGRVLGDKYHQLYAPIRVILGFGLLIPLSDGFSAGHYLLRDVIGRAAIQLGNAPIKAYMEKYKSNPISVVVKSTQGERVFDALFDSEMCLRYFNEQRQYNTFLRTITYPPRSRRQYIRDGVEYFNYGVCGELQLNTFTSDGSAHKLTAVARSGLTLKMADNIAKYLDRFNWETVIALLPKENNFNEASVALAGTLRENGYVPGDFHDFRNKRIEVWNNGLRKKAKVIYQGSLTEQQSSQLFTLVDKGGFMMAGAYERILSKIAATTTTVINELPDYSSPSETLLGPSVAGYSWLVTTFKNVSNMSTASSTPASDPSETGQGGEETPTEPINNKASSQKYAMGKIEGAFEDIISTTSPRIMGSPGLDWSEWSNDPVGDMIWRGRMLLLGADVAIIGMATMEGATFAARVGTASSWLVPAIGVGGAAFIEKFVGNLLGWLSYGVLVALIAGMLHTYILPLIPFVMVLIMGFGWAVAFLEAAIAVVLWAFVFIRMDGQDLVDQQQSAGVGLLFNLLLRPAIGMLAFIGCMALLPVMINTLNVSWGAVWDLVSVDRDSLNPMEHPANIDVLSWIWTFIAETVIIMFLQWHFTLRLYSMIPTIADRVGAWMGINSAGYQDQHESHAAVAAVTGATAGGANAIMSNMKPAGPKPDGKGKGKGNGGKNDLDGPTTPSKSKSTEVSQGPIQK